MEYGNKIIRYITLNINILISDITYLAYTKHSVRTAPVPFDSALFFLPNTDLNSELEGEDLLIPANYRAA